MTVRLGRARVKRKSVFGGSLFHNFWPFVALYAIPSGQNKNNKISDFKIKASALNNAGSMYVSFPIPFSPPSLPACDTLLRTKFTYVLVGFGLAMAVQFSIIAK